MDGLSDAESRLWIAYSRGDRVDLRVGDPGRDDPANAEQWDESRTVRAEMIRELLLGRRDADPGHVAGVRLTGARLTGVLDVNHANVDCPIELTGCAFTDRPMLSFARLRSVDLEDSHLPGLDAFATAVDGSLSFIGARVTGSILLYGARVTGDLDFDRAHLTSDSPGSDAVSASTIEIGRNLYGHGLTADGDLDFAGAQIGRSIRFESAGDPRGCHIRGAFMLLNGRVGDYVDLSGAELTNPGGFALRGNRLVVGGAFTCESGFRSDGEIRLRNAQVGGTLSTSGANLSNAGGVALTLANCQIRELRLQPDPPYSGVFDLRHSQIGVLIDDPDHWPTELRLDGLTYDAVETPLTARQRLSWLDRDPDGYRAQPYEHLATVYQRLGWDADARAVRHAKQRRQGQTSTMLPKAWGMLQDVTVGFGYRPLRAALWLLALLAIGTVSYGLHHPPPAVPGQGPQFNPLVYSLDLLLPIVEFGQQEAFTPRGDQQWLAYGLIAAGWILATTVAAGVARTLGRQ